MVGVTSFSVGQVSRLAGVTVRTLHHYDDIGLLSPGERTAAGYRRYTEADLVRLQQVLLYRELGFALEEVAVILDEPRADELTHLRRRHELLVARSERLSEVIAAAEEGRLPPKPQPRSRAAVMCRVDLSPLGRPPRSAPPTPSRERGGPFPGCRAAGGGAQPELALGRPLRRILMSRMSVTATRSRR
ncbi:MerR family transcriptional regulator [Nonomuraea sp. NPDC052129]|uniref:MerR family transcriptional regulator n=1 Tax=Nonomuraea sp. NPDC052129 TaxID=3154651 RepID=UPI00341E0C93